eukprot:TRINITY_DN3292_c0_g1_i4.p1 TRINITY_DN3292_c0_g1~~TRINITY_DN3292_c0_g1_i4.p1  ORF type:complete len:147 (-),score=30.96 TRINITY_DN3292_c0_g1_i4:78-518(-)
MCIRDRGGAVAIQLAAQLVDDETAIQPAGVIIENTFTCIEDMVGSVFPPLGWAVKYSPALRDRFLRLQWRSIDVISQITYPILMLSSLEDEIVPAGHMQLLKASATGSKSCVLESFHATHNDIWMAAGEGYWQVKKRFIEQCHIQP